MGEFFFRLEADTKLLGILLLALLLHACSFHLAPSTYKGKKLINERFTYWEQYDIFVDTAGIQPSLICEGTPIDSSYIVQMIYSKLNIEDTLKRRVIYRNLNPLYRVSKKSNFIGFTLLYDPKGLVRAYRFNQIVDVSTLNEAAYCISRYRFEPNQGDTCMEAVEICVKVDVN